MPRTAWWPKKGSKEWVQYDFRDAKEVADGQTDCTTAVQKAIVTDNIMKGEVRIDNRSKHQVHISGNLGD